MFRTLHLIVTMPILALEATVFAGAADVFNSSTLPHTAREWGAVFAYAILFIVARIVEFLVNRATITKAANRAVIAVTVPAIAAVTAAAVAAPIDESGTVSDVPGPPYLGVAPAPIFSKSN